jgi:hypothetical protein
VQCGTEPCLIRFFRGYHQWRASQVELLAGHGLIRTLASRIVNRRSKSIPVPSLVFFKLLMFVCAFVIDPSSVVLERAPIRFFHSISFCQLCLDWTYNSLCRQWKNNVYGSLCLSCVGATAPAIQSSCLLIATTIDRVSCWRRYREAVLHSKWDEKHTTSIPKLKSYIIF